MRHWAVPGCQLAELTQYSCLAAKSAFRPVADTWEGLHALACVVSVCGGGQANPRTAPDPKHSALT